MKNMRILGIAFVVAVCLFIFVEGYRCEEAMAEEFETSFAIEEEEIPMEKEKPTEIVIIDLDKEFSAWSDIPLTAEEQETLWDKCNELEVNYWMLIALCESESNFKADAVGDHGKSIGYMQINKVNWERMKTQYNLDVNKPIDNLLCGAYMFKELADKYDTITQVVMGYKCGERRASELIEQGVILSAVEDITNRAIELENTHRRED